MIIYEHISPLLIVETNVGFAHIKELLALFEPILTDSLRFDDSADYRDAGIMRCSAFTIQD